MDWVDEIEKTLDGIMDVIYPVIVVGAISVYVLLIAVQSYHFWRG